MSMSQEEIESLMNGLDFEDDAATPEAPAVEEPISEGNMSEDDINALIAQTEDIPAAPEATNETIDEQSSVDELLNSLDNTPSNEEVSSDDIDDLLKDLESSEPASDALDTNFDDILSTIDGIEDNEPVEVVEPVAPVAVQPEVVQSPAPVVEKVEEPVSTVSADIQTAAKDWTDNKIQQGVFPLPVEEDTKVVNQLSEVANDSEEKASKIFDVLSNILDYNGEIQSGIQNLTEFNNKQIAMLESLNQKFPNIEAFKANLTHAQQMGDNISAINCKVDDGNNEIFQAMELMQFHDINRQKIERVMSVIRKLSTYLNNLFEDDGNHNEVAVAKHIHGDNTEDLLGDDDLESLIAEFGN